MDDMVQCEECKNWFMVVYNYNGVDTPEYCPMCGAEMDYSEAGRKDDQ